MMLFFNLFVGTKIRHSGLPENGKITVSMVQIKEVLKFPGHGATFFATP
jgi:hypothetical protein